MLHQAAGFDGDASVPEQADEAGAGRAGRDAVAAVYVCSSMVDRNGGLWVKSQCVLDNGGVSCTWNSIQQWSEFTQCPEQSLVLQDPLRPAYLTVYHYYAVHNYKIGTQL